jgi:nicotinate-nucleotide pyrophosphorylase (carboxylating)
VDWQAPAISRALDRWLDEDIGRGDLTAIALQGQYGAAH